MEMLNGLRREFSSIQEIQLKQQDDVITLTQAAIYEDKRAHFVFSDKTGLILHPNGDCFTMFAKSGMKNRQLVRYATNSAAKETSSGGLDKLLLALQFFNTYGNEPILARDE